MRINASAPHFLVTLLWAVMAGLSHAQLDATERAIVAWSQENVDDAIALISIRFMNPVTHSRLFNVQAAGRLDRALPI